MKRKSPYLRIHDSKGPCLPQEVALRVKKSKENTLCMKISSTTDSKISSKHTSTLGIHVAFFSQKLISIRKNNNKKSTFGLLAENQKYTTEVQYVCLPHSDFLVKTDRATNSVHSIDTAEQPDITGIQTMHPNRGRFICDSRLSSW